jgi:flagellar biosynthesis/type III secretory pathway protein FliH
MIYEARMKEMRDQAAWLDEAQTKGLAAGKAEGLAAGKAEGLAQGMAEGIAQGIAQGITQGITQGLTQGITQGIAEGEGRKARELALKLREKGMADSEILELTGIDLGS